MESRDARGDAHRPPLAWWGGVEATVNRVGDTYHDQLARSRHASRLTDLDAFAALGFRALRVPVLWEHAQTQPGGEVCLELASQLVERTRAVGLGCVAGLVHHGSGPRFTNLLDPGFADGLARYAAAVARRFPWLEAYTPINEPLTTARFSGLYGHWYPHHRATPSFLRMLVHECTATARAMAAVREINPAAQLVQTEDVGTICASPHLTYQADYENLRRYLSFDLLCGLVDRHHPLYRHLLLEGIHERELMALVEEPCPPDVLGINYYVTSDRFLDGQTDAYPPERVGGNGRHRYADIEAVRAEGIGMAGHRAVLRDVWQRYGRPVALTEVHLGCTREEQMRWLAEAHEAALTARAEGVDVRAITVWALLGSYDWNSLVTRDAGYYESGVYDVRGPTPRPTALAAMVKGLATEGRFEHPVLQGAPWWRRGEGARGACTRRPLLVTGGAGELALAVARACEARGLDLVRLDRADLDITDGERVRSAVQAHRPWAILNAAGSQAQGGHPSEARLTRNDVAGAACLADVCAEQGIRLVTFSSDRVFDGLTSSPYVERDPVSPCCGFGSAKAEAERRVLGRCEDALVVRAGALLSARLSRLPAHELVRMMLDGSLGSDAASATVSPTYVPHLVHACLDLLIDGAFGIWHLANVGAVRWQDLGHSLAERLGVAVEGNELRASGPYRALASERGSLMPALDEAVEHFLRERQAAA